VIVAGVAAYQAVNGNKQAVQLREQVQGKASDAIDNLRGLIDDNTQ
jgi:hypothetical protein